MSAVLQVENLSVAFGFDKNGTPRDGIQPLQVTDKVSFEIAAGEFFALVGESGCGKSVTAMSILRLLPQPSARIVEGSVLYRAGDDASPIDLAKMPLADLQKVRGSEIACIFQEPMQALNPVLTIKNMTLASDGNNRLIRIKFHDRERINQPIKIFKEYPDIVFLIFFPVFFPKRVRTSHTLAIYPPGKARPTVTITDVNHFGEYSETPWAK
jgi:ABC-type dipeptide/oligopeptide/nickel transport system ATPase component